MKKNRITLLLAGGCLLCVVGAIVMKVGPGSGDPGDSEDRPESRSGRTTRSASEAPDFDHVSSQEPAQIRRVGQSDGRTPTRRDTDPRDTPDARTDDRSAGVTVDEIDPFTLPMATKGREQGIDTTMDEDWSPASEAAEWFDPLQDAFEAARPLTPDRYNEVLGDFRESTVDVFKRAGEIGDVEGPTAGIAFIDEYNTLVDDYKREAYGESPR